MGRSKGVMISVKIPIKWEAMTDRSKQRLRQIVGRDTRVVRSYLGIIEQHEDKLLTGRNKIRIHSGRLDQLTMTAIMVKSGISQRLSVDHDFKARFPRISTNELQECRLTAVSMYESYLKLRNKRGRRASRPTSINGTRRIPRWVFSRRFQLVKKKSPTAIWWLDLCDSLDSVQERKQKHDRQPP